MENNDISWISLKEKGNILFKEGKYKEAITYYEEALKINNSIDILYSNIATCQKCLNLYQEAINNYKKALQLNPNNTKNLHRLSNIYILTGNIKEAKKIQEKILTLEPNNPLYIEQMNSINNDIINNEIQMINKEIIFKNYKKAEEICIKLLEKVPRNLNYKLYFIKILLYNSNINEINNFIEKEENEEDKKIEEEFYYLQKITRELSENNIIENSLKIKIKLLIDRLNEIFNKNKYRESIEIYNKLIELITYDRKIISLILINRALCYKKLNKITVAFSDLNQSIKINSYNYDAFYQRSKIFSEYKMIFEAKSDLEKAEKIRNDSSAYLNDTDFNIKYNIYSNNYYKKFGVNSNASIDEIRKGYKKLIMKLNPDKYYENEEEQKLVKNIFFKINNAFEILSDENKRKGYDNKSEMDYLEDPILYSDIFLNKNIIDNNKKNNYIRKQLLMNKEIINDEKKDDEIIIKYKVDFDNSNSFIEEDNILEENVFKNIGEKGIKLFGKKFIEKNKKNCFFILNNFKYKLNSIINKDNLDIQNENGEFEIKLIGFNEIYDMSYMFANCITLSSLKDFHKINTSKIINMSYLFYKCSSLEFLPDISKWNTENVKDMSYMFSGCLSLIYLPDISKWNTKNVVNAKKMFEKCRCLSVIPDISKWDITNLTDINGIFDGCESLCFLPKFSKNFNVNLSFKGIHNGCYSLSYIPKMSINIHCNEIFDYVEDKIKCLDCINAINYRL